jgi:hypothetical protein
MSSVFPGVDEVFANRLLLVSILIRLDLPTFERPMKAYSGFVSLGHMLTTGADSVNSACLISIAYMILAAKVRKNIRILFCRFTKNAYLCTRIQKKACLRPVKRHFPIFVF